MDDFGDKDDDAHESPCGWQGWLLFSWDLERNNGFNTAGRVIRWYIHY